ncbi:co-chaperone Hsc20 family protein [Histomonas meleagridis]|uniref:co-chaperone Hsc20 family protein n=1 Tax=Histomonas meleagridis TaxID=135588 RepID=UPI00355A32CD|nr:co-chaperone Hsc20 family protein [Histomonas meleagridis]KAH0801557.1 co-chaperone Hsc20 family protein [Histomonas meleagridis]
MLSLHNPHQSFLRAFANQCKEVCCWNCHLQQPHKDCEFFCKNCHKLLPAKFENYFSLFNQPKTYDIDLAKLEKAYKAYQRQVHPDRFFQSSEFEMKNADNVSCCVNDGYKTLKDPIKRAEYILELFKKKTVVDVPPDFLMEVLDIHEQISATSKSPVLKQLLDQVDQIFNDESGKLSKSLKIIDDKQVSNPEGAAKSIAKLKYLNRIRNMIHEKLPLASE